MFILKLLIKTLLTDFQHILILSAVSKSASNQRTERMQLYEYVPAHFSLLPCRRLGELLIND